MQYCSRYLYSEAWSLKDSGHSCNNRQAVHFTIVKSHIEISTSPEMSPQLITSLYNVVIIKTVSIRRLQWAITL